MKKRFGMWRYKIEKQRVVVLPKNNLSAAAPFSNLFPTKALAHKNIGRLPKIGKSINLVNI